MKHQIRSVFFLLALFIGACRLEAPTISSGNVVVYEQGRVVQSRPLNSTQVVAVSSWLRANSSGWQHYIATPSAEVSAKLVAVDQTVIGLYILNRTVIVNANATQYSQMFSEPELKQLRKALGLNKS